MGIDICSALKLCADQNIIHYDIKPQNIFINDFGDYKLGDLGNAGMINRMGVVSKAFSPDYVSPELYFGRPVSAAADIYSLAMVMYWLLNERRLPFMPLPPAVPGYTEWESAKQRRLSGEPVPEPRHGSAELKRIILKALRFSPEDRYGSASEMKAELQNLCWKHDNIRNNPSQDDLFVRAGDLSLKHGMHYEMNGSQNGSQNDPALRSYRSDHGWDKGGFDAGRYEPVREQRIQESNKKYLQENQYQYGEEKGVSDSEDPGSVWHGSEPVKKKEKPILIVLVTAIAVMLGISFFIISQRGCGGSKAADELITRYESNDENSDSDEEVKAESGSDAQEEDEAQAAGELSESDAQEEDEVQDAEEPADADTDADSSDKTSADIPDNPVAKMYLEPEKANQTVTEKGGDNGRYTVYTYDSKGAIAEEACYLWDDTLEYRRVYHRNENGAPLRYEDYSNEDQRASFGIYTLDANGFIASLKVYDEENNLSYENSFTNDAEGNCLTEEYKGKKYYFYNKYEIPESVKLSVFI